MKKFIGTGVVALGLLFSVSFAVPAQAAGLTETQIQAVVNLVASFGADAATVKNVEASLRGQSTTPTTGTSACLDLKHALVIGSTDATTNGEVSKLQRFLGAYKEHELYTTAPDNQSGASATDLQPVTGYYGSKTAASVMQWQKAHGMDFVTTKSGVGPMTRAKMKCADSAGPAIQKINWRIETANPSITDENDYRKYEQAIFVDVIRADSSIRGYSVGKAYGCIGSTVESLQGGKKVFGQVSCNFAEVGAYFTAYTQSGKFIVERQNESGRDGLTKPVVLLEI